MNNQVKICGIKSPEFIDICAKAGADLIGFVNFKKSPRHVALNHIPALIKYTPKGLKTVVLKVNPSIEEVEFLAHYKPDYLQLHGTESPEFCQQIKHHFDLKLIKAIGVKTPDDVMSANVYQDCVDILLFDSKADASAALPGGNGMAFNWDLLKNQTFNCFTMLAGGVNKDNVAQAKQMTGVSNVDVSSAVEITRGVKDRLLIEEFVKNSKA